MLAIEADPTHYFQSILGLQKLTKEHLVLFSAAVSMLRTALAANPSLLKQSLVRCLELADSKKLYPYLLSLAAVVLSVLETIPGQLVSYLFNFMSAHRDALPIAQAARCLLLLSSVSETGKFTDFTCLILSIWPAITPEAGLLYLAISKTNRRRLFDEAIPRIASEFLEQQQPSLFCVGLRLVSRGLAVLPDKGIQSLLKHCLTRLTKQFVRFIRLPTVSEIASASFLAILTTPSYKKGVAHVLNAADKIIPYPDAAEFPPLVFCLLEMLSRCMDGKQTDSVHKHLTIKARALVTIPASYFLAKTYIRVVSTRIEKLVDVQNREASLWKLVNAWFDGGPDCYNMCDIVREWMFMIYHAVGVRAVITFIHHRISKPGLRFFVVIAAIHRFLTGLRSQASTSMETIRADLEAAGTQLEASCTARGVALRLIANGTDVKSALDLASWGADCPETEAILRALRGGDTPEQTEELPLGDDGVGSISPGDQFEPITGACSSCEGFDRIVQSPEVPYEGIDLPAMTPDTYRLWEPIYPGLSPQVPPPSDEDGFERIEVDQEPEPEPFVEADSPVPSVDTPAPPPLPSIRSEFLGLIGTPPPPAAVVSGPSNAEDDWDDLLKF
jgi:hypothetical protein